MHFTTFIANVAVFGLASAVAIEERSCIDGSYAVKIEAHHVGCTDVVPAASIANYGGPAGGCISTLDGTNWLKAFNDGCASSSIDLHCYSTLEQCDADPSGAGGALTCGLAPGSCTEAPLNCPYYRAVAGPGC